MTGVVSAMKQKLSSSSDPNAGPSDIPVDKHLTLQNFGKMCEVIQKVMSISLFPGTINLGHIEFYSYDIKKCLHYYIQLCSQSRH